MGKKRRDRKTKIRNKRPEKTCLTAWTKTHLRCTGSAILLWSWYSSGWVPATDDPKMLGWSVRLPSKLSRGTNSSRSRISSTLGSEFRNAFCNSKSKPNNQNVFLNSEPKVELILLREELVPNQNQLIRMY